jgi:hypothetical protein
LITLAVAALCSACTDRGPGPAPKKIEASYLRENTLKAVPEGLQRIDASLAGKVLYLGNKIAYADGRSSDSPLAPGGTIRVFHYWQVLVPPGSQFKVFSLVRGAENTVDFMNLGPTDMEIGLPVGKWKSGQIIQDVQDITLRPDWHSPTATVYVGLVEQHGNQIGDRMPVSAQDASLIKDRAIVARTITVDLSKAPPPAGTVYVPHATSPITIDGVANEPAWTSAATSTEFATADGSPEPVGKAIARMTWDEQSLYLFVSVTDTDIFSGFKNHDDPLWKQDCVEMFVDADGNRSGYVELQVNPNNATFDSYFATTRAQPGDEKWDSNMVTAVKVRGTADKEGDTDQGWDVEIAIPLAAVKGRSEQMQVTLPPQVGNRWKLNVVRVDSRSGGGGPSASSWNRISYSDFHALDKMLTVVFADASGSISATRQGTPVQPQLVPAQPQQQVVPTQAAAVQPQAVPAAAGSSAAAPSGSGVPKTP